MTIEELKDVMQCFDNTEIREFSFKNGTSELNLSKNHPLTVEHNTHAEGISPASSGSTTPTEQQHTHPVASNEQVITSPLVGTFYRSPGPDAPSFVEKGQTCTAQTTIGIIEAMKIMNELKAESNCVIEEILVHDGQVVEFGTPLFRIKNL